jgi:hypothetical protein
VKGRQNRQIFRNRVNRRFGFEDLVKQTTNKTVKHVGGETIQVKQFPNTFKLLVKVFIATAEVENSVK